MTPLTNRLNLEHRKQKVAPLSQFMFRMGKFALFAFFMIAISVLAGMAGYHWIGELNWPDSFYMSCMILTGMGPVSEMPSDAGKIFSSCFA